MHRSCRCASGEVPLVCIQLPLFLFSHARSCLQRDRCGPYLMGDLTWLTESPVLPLSVGQYVNNFTQGTCGVSHDTHASLIHMLCIVGYAACWMVLLALQLIDCFLPSLYHFYMTLCICMLYFGDVVRWVTLHI